MTATDTELIQRAQHGDSKAIGDLYLAHHEQTYRYICAKVYDPTLAEDLTGEVFIRMVTRLPDYRDVGIPFRAWLYRIARNLVVDHFRKANRGFTVSLEEERVKNQMDEHPATEVETRLTLERLKQAMEQIESDQAEVIRLRFMVSLPIQEVAERLEKTVAAVKALQHRGVIAIRVILQ